MKRLLWLLLLLASPAFSQTWNAYQNFTFTSVTTAPVMQENTTVLFHQITWTPTGMSGCTVSIDSSPDNSVWTVGGILAGQTCTSGGSSSIASGNANYVRVNVTSFTGTSVNVVYKGYTSNPVNGGGTLTGITAGTGVNVSGSATSPTVTLLNPFMGVLTIDGANHTTTGGFNTTNLCTGLKGINDNPATFVYKVVDALPYDSEPKDPWNDATCANGFSAYNGALTYEFGSMNFIIGWGGTMHLPASSVFNLHGRGSENQLSLANGCGTATPTQCTGTLFAAYTTAAPWTGSFVMTCPGCTTFPASTPGIDYVGSGVSSFGTQLNGPGTLTMSGITGSIGVQNTGCQENCSIRDMTIVGAQAIALDINNSNAQNFHIGSGIEIISGARTGLASAGGPGTPAAFVGVKWSVNGPNRDIDNVTCNTRGTATTTSIAACIEVIGPGGSGMPTGHIHHIHTENVKIAVLCDACRNFKIDNVNTGGATQDASTPTAMVYICGVASPAPCTTGLTATKVNVEVLSIISPSLMPNMIVDDTNTRTITAAQWRGTYTDPPSFSSALPALEGGTNSQFFNVLGLTASRNVTFPDVADTVMELGQANVLAAGGGLDAHSVTSATAFRIPAIAGATATVSGALNYDTTNKNLHFAINAADTIVPTTSVTPVNGNVPTWVVTTGNDKLGDSGVPPALKAFLTTTYTNATTTFSTVTGLSFAVAASTNYHIRCDLDYQTSATTADVKIQFTGPASPTAVTYDLVTYVTASTLSAVVATAFSTSLSEAGTPTTATNFPMTVTLTLINGVNAGTVTLQAAATGTGTISILPGACVMQ